MEFVCDSVMPTIHLGSRDHASIFVAYTGLRGFIIALVGVVTFGEDTLDPKKTKKKTKGSRKNGGLFCHVCEKKIGRRPQEDGGSARR
jgi:hypothetical protein